MASHRIRRNLTIAIALSLGLLALAVVALLALRIPGNAAGMAAKGVCSAAFVAQRPIAGLLQAEVLPASQVGEGCGYGAQTWRYGDPQQGRCKSHRLPPDTIAMGGHWGQVVAMVPSRNAVIVRLGWTFRGGQFDSCALIAAVLKTLPP